MEFREYPPTPIVGVGGVLLRDERVLLVRRKREPGAGLWSIPGGHVRLGETLEEACVREMLEETGLEVEPVRPIYAFDYIERDGKGNVKYHYVVVDFLCRQVGGSLKPGGDAKEVRWIPLDQALKLRLTSSTRKLLEELKRPFTIVVRNRDVERVLFGVPAGHRHARTLFILRDGSKIVFQEATMENVARAVVNVEMHPSRRAIALRRVELPRDVRKPDYDSNQLLEEDLDEGEIVAEITRELGMDVAEEEGEGGSSGGPCQKSSRSPG